LEKSYPTATLSTTNITHPVLGSNPGLHGTGWQLTTSAMAWPMTEEAKVLFYPMFCDFLGKELLFEGVQASPIHLSGKGIIK